MLGQTGDLEELTRFLVGVRSMWDEVQTRDELMKRIREDKFLSDDERLQALAFAERYPETKEGQPVK